MSVVLVEGESDRVAVETLAARRGVDLRASGVSIAVLGGAHAVGRHVANLRAGGLDGAVVGLCDAGEEAYFARAGVRAFVCRPDLESELIRALGGEAVEKVIERLGELRSFRSFQKQPFQRGRELYAQLHRFMGTHSGRKALYARALVEALDGRAPGPLEELLGAL